MAYRVPKFSGVFDTHPTVNIDGFDSYAERTISRDGEKDKKQYWQGYIYKHQGTGHYIGVWHSLDKPWRPIDLKRLDGFIKNFISSGMRTCGCCICIPSMYEKGYPYYINFREGCWE
jgi:hypothetical protein